MFVVRLCCSGTTCPGPGNREQFDKQFKQGNYKAAYEGYRGLALDPKPSPQHAGTDLGRAIECLVKLGRVDEVDAFREAVIAVHKASWRLLQAAAESYLNDPNKYGFIVAGQVPCVARIEEQDEFVGADKRDRSRAMQLLSEGLDPAQVGPRPCGGGPLPSDACPRL